VFPNKSQSNEFQKKDEISGWYVVEPALTGDVTTYEITGLKPSTYYEVKVTAANVEGSSDEKPMIFLTSLGKNALIILYIFNDCFIYSVEILQEVKQ